jgi:Cu-Zn family superoxide dismutase
MTCIRAICIAVAIMFSMGDALALASGGKEAVAVIYPTSGNTCKGVVHFTQVASTVWIVADLEGLPPNSKHGFHIHEYGDCSAADGSSAGGHYDAALTKHHGMPSDKVRHTGDMGNIEADENGRAHFELGLENASIDGEQAPILGRAVIIHAGVDDFSQPAGNAGARIACGVIGLAKTK